MKSVVLTSSRIAAFRPNGTSQRISDKEWFDEAPNLYDKVPDQMKGAITYASSKVAGERAAWKWTETEKVSELLMWKGWRVSLTSNFPHLPA